MKIYLHNFDKNNLNKRVIMELYRMGRIVAGISFTVLGILALYNKKTNPESWCKKTKHGNFFIIFYFILGIIWIILIFEPY